MNFLKLFLFCFLSQSVLSFSVGDRVSYEQRVLGGGTYAVSEKIIEVDEEFGAHLVETITANGTTTAWRYNEYSYIDAEKIFAECESNYGGVIETLVYGGKKYKTCKTKGGNISLADRHGNEDVPNIVGDLSGSWNANFWVAPGPYNGIFKVIDRFNGVLYNIDDYRSN